MSNEPNDIAAYAEGTRLHWVRWAAETEEEFRTRATAEGERLGLSIVFQEIPINRPRYRPHGAARSRDAAA